MNHLWRSRMMTMCRTCSTAVDRQRMMPFEQYRKLRRRLKFRSRVAGVPGALAGVALSSAVNVHFHPQMLEFQNPEAELTHILGMDPLAFAVLCGIGSGTVGFLFGGSVFNVIWNIVFKNRSKELQQREEDFLRRLEHHRFSDINKFDDDYYGDKINTLFDYRQWVRQQQRKKTNAMNK